MKRALRQYIRRGISLTLAVVATLALAACGSREAGSAKGDKGDRGTDGSSGADGLSIYYCMSSPTINPETDVYEIPGQYVDSYDNREIQNGDLIFFKGNSSLYYVSGYVGGTDIPVVFICSLKGDKGDTGVAGAAGSNGNDGTSVTVTSVNESSADGGSNVVTFSDGKTVTIKNGSKGSTGDTGADGADGEDGQRGTGLLAVTTAPSSYTTEVGGVTPTYRIALSTVKTQAGVSEVLVGDTIRYSYYHYPIIYVDDSYAYCRARVSIRGATGAAGATPVKGTDYYTDADKTEMVNAVKAALNSETWVFTLSGGTTVQKEVLLK